MPKRPVPLHRRRFVRRVQEARARLEAPERVASRDTMAKQQKTEGWFQQLEDGRVEVFMRATGISGVPDTKIRASGSPEAINQVAEWFEEHTGLRIDAPWRTRTIRQIEGQTSLELSSHDATVPGDG